METLLKQLDRIAKENNEDFIYSVELSLSHPDVPVVYHFTATESSNRHVFLSGTGSTMEYAAEQAKRFLKDSCLSWGYQYVE